MLPIYLALLDSQEEKDKFITIYETWRDLLYYIAGQYLSAQADREIAVDSALHSVLQALDSIGDPASAKTKNLLVVVTRNKCIDLLRRKNGAVEEPWDGEDGASAAAKTTAAPAAEGEDSLTAAVQSLPAPSRDVLVLRYYHGYSAREIGLILGIGYEAARKRLQRAKAELKGIWEDEG